MSRSSGDQSTTQSASDAEFRATFSLLPLVNNIMRTLAGGQGDPKAVQKTVSLTLHISPCTVCSSLRGGRATVPVTPLSAATGELPVP